MFSTQATKIIRNVQNNDTNRFRNMVTGVLNREQMFPRNPQNKLPSKHCPPTPRKFFALEMKTNIHLIHGRYLKRLRERLESEKLKPTKDAASRKEFLDMFKWEGSLL